MWAVSGGRRGSIDRIYGFQADDISNDVTYNDVDNECMYLGLLYMLRSVCALNKTSTADGVEQLLIYLADQSFSTA
jgi:hypothetical protein